MSINTENTASDMKSMISYRKQCSFLLYAVSAAVSRSACPLETCFLYQMFLLCPAHMFNGIFPAHGFLFCLKCLIIGQHHRTSGFGILGPFTLVMDLQTLVQVIGPAAVKRAVRTGEDIGIIHGYPSFPVNKLLTAIKGRPFKGVPFLFHFIR